ncbi:T-cell receptor gamma alternate reading frame protein isoform X3 [Loxodonta africana]|uniref:T-cell receptor gamma alternate reading frame protein isoform X3 n=1 Tax=Loxodonta africana TaxID=9785 RepID=UPI000C812DB7|nr:TCR gamma alternate reading frame protein isoform X3 [Loxodonta africana]XP_023400022.1 TCR gamma alternate reading frame protein isoform X4 [Loxodonta africana]
MLWSPALLLAFLALASQKASSLDMRKISVTKQRGTSVVITCDLDLNVNYIHWYRYREGEALQRLLYYYIPTSAVTMDSGFNSRKYHASGNTATNCKVELKNLEESDSGVYYCAAWDYDRKLFGGGTKLIVTDKSLDADLSPKPTIFLPSVSETIEHKAGTYLCLLEKFFPDVIKVDWKEKNSNRILESQQGHTIKTGDTFMKFSWLTVTEKSWDKDHQCVVKHENIKEADKMILFPSIKRGLEDGVIGPTPSPGDAAGSDPVQSGKGADIALTNSTKACLKDEDDTLQLQLTNTSAYYTYLLLLLKSAVYLAMVVFCLLRRTEVCGDGKSS